MNENLEYKIYARVDSDGIVTKIFCDEFEEVKETDLFIKSTDNRHEANSYSVLDKDGIFNYCISNGALALRDKSLDVIKVNNKNRILELKKLLASTDYKAIKFAEGELSYSEYEDIKIQRRMWRSEINSLEEE